MGTFVTLECVVLNTDGVELVQVTAQLGVKQLLGFVTHSQRLLLHLRRRGIFPLITVVEGFTVTIVPRVFVVPNMAGADLAISTVLQDVKMLLEFAQTLQLRQQVPDPQGRQM